MTQSDALRLEYAQRIMRLVEIDDPSLCRAFALVKREVFCGRGPWNILSESGYTKSPSSDLAYCYDNVLIGLDPSNGINNGEPSLHAKCLSALNIKTNDHVVHIGAGTGYYTAIISHLSGPGGPVIAYEISPYLANEAITNLAQYGNVTVEPRSGTTGVLPPSDVIYVSAGATGPLRLWIKALKLGGRLLFPLTSDAGAGGMLLITRINEGLYSAEFVCRAMFIACIGARSSETGQRLEAAFAVQDINAVRSLRLDSMPDVTCWFSGPDWWLSTSL